MTLIERIEAATGPDRELDYAIADAVDSLIEESSGRRYCFAYTGYIDAALTLIPEGCEWSVALTHDGRGIAEVWGGGFCSEAATPALALCVVGLLQREVKA